MTISEEGRNALAEWKKIRDYTIPSVTLSFSEEEAKLVLEVVLAEKIPFNFGYSRMPGCGSFVVPAALVCVFSHLSPKIIDDADMATLIAGRGRRRLPTPEESSELMKQEAKKWQKE